MKLFLLILASIEIKQTIGENILCYQCEAATKNRKVTRGKATCYDPGQNNNLPKIDAGETGQCISTYSETRLSNGDKVTTVKHHFSLNRNSTDG